MNSKSARPSDRLPAGWLDQTDTKQRVLGELALRAVVRQRRRRRLAVGVAVMALLLSAVGLSRWRAQSPSAIAVTSPLREALPDGSVVERKDDAVYTIQFTPEARYVTLTRGAAHFEVTKNPARPFIVTAGGVTVRAVGTAFAVDLGLKAVEVLVTEGRVAVAPANSNAAAGEPATVDAGAGVRVDLSVLAGGGLQVQTVAAAELEQKLAWRARLLELSGTPLDELVAMLNRENRVQFSIADPALGKMKLSGLIRPDRVAGVVQLLEDEGVRVERRGDAVIVLHRAAKN